ncbi:hypothetical protein ABIB40_002870 [Pedobacter sp. UYP30]|uniref:hypothetical protein n=1 Tax=Pedobacter sp. UYP30 TaxID=1756400 RepID=UPI00339B3D32
MADQLSIYGEAVVWSFDLLGLSTPDKDEDEQSIELALAAYLNELVANDFNKLIGILYRIDISQEKAVAALAEGAETETAGEILASLIINRQKEKIYYRKLYSK